MSDVRCIPVTEGIVCKVGVVGLLSSSMAATDVHRRMSAARCMSGVRCSPGVRDTLSARCVAATDARRMPGARCVAVTRAR